MKNNRLFRHDFYPHEWLTQTSHMNPMQKGIFIDLVAMIYARGGPIKNDHHHIARLSNCSPRMASKIINELLTNGDIQLVENPVDNLWMITQRRCEKEIFGKLSHLQSSSKGGRNRHENEGESKQISLLGSSSNSTPPHSPSTPLTESVTARGGAGKLERGKFDVTYLLDDSSRARAKKAADGWDIYHLIEVYNSNVRSGRMDPPNEAKAAFPEWCRSYTKGRPPG